MEKNEIQELLVDSVKRIAAENLLARMHTVGSSTEVRERGFQEGLSTLETHRDNITGGFPEIIDRVNGVIDKYKADVERINNLAVSVDALRREFREEYNFGRE